MVNSLMNTFAGMKVGEELRQQAGLSFSVQKITTRLGLASNIRALCSKFCCAKRKYLTPLRLIDTVPNQYVWVKVAEELRVQAGLADRVKARLVEVEAQAPRQYQLLAFRSRKLQHGWVLLVI